MYVCMSQAAVYMSEAPKHACMYMPEKPKHVKMYVWLTHLGKYVCLGLLDEYVCLSQTYKTSRLRRYQIPLKKHSKSNV